MKKQVLDNIFIFRESEKSLKETPLGLFVMMNNFTSLKRIRKKTQKFDIEF